MSKLVRCRICHTSKPFNRANFTPYGSGGGLNNTCLECSALTPFQQIEKERATKLAEALAAYPNILPKYSK